MYEFGARPRVNQLKGAFRPRGLPHHTRAENKDCSGFQPIFSPALRTVVSIVSLEELIGLSGKCWPKFAYTGAQILDWKATESLSVNRAASVSGQGRLLIKWPIRPYLTGHLTRHYFATFWAQVILHDWDEWISGLIRKLIYCYRHLT